VCMFVCVMFIATLEELIVREPGHIHYCAVNLEQLAHVQ